VLYIGPRGAQNVQQVNAWLPAQIRTGLVPIQLRRNGGALCSPRSARIVPPGPLVPRLVSITDGINLSQLNRITTGVLKIALEEVNAPGSIHAAIAGRTLERVAILCVDPVPPRYEINFKLPGDLPPGGYALEVQVGARKLLPAMIEVNS